MENWRGRLAEVLRGNVDYAVWAAQVAMAAQPARADKYAAPDLRQMVDGFYAVIEEALANGSGETRRFFLETVIPGLVANGDKPSEIAETVATWALLVVEKVAPLLPADSREPAIQWLAPFIGRYIADIVEAGASAQPT